MQRALVAALLALCLASSARAITWEATLNGENQDPPLDVPTTGTFFMKPAGTGEGVFEWVLEVTDAIDITMSHIHWGNATTNGPPIFLLAPGGNVTDGLPQFPTPENGNRTYESSFSLNDLLPANITNNYTVAQFLAAATGGDSENSLYVNVHSVSYPDGVIRGQVYTIPEPEPTPGPTPAPAPPLMPELMHWEAILNGTNQYPDAVDTPTTATFYMSVGPVGVLIWDMFVYGAQNMSMAHIHIGNATTNGLPVALLVPPGKEMTEPTLPGGLPQYPAPGVSGDVLLGASLEPRYLVPANLTGYTWDDLMADLNSGDSENYLYVNVHSEEFPNGVIRGQLYTRAGPRPPFSAPPPPPAPTPAPAPAPSSGAATLGKASALLVLALAALFM